MNQAKLPSFFDRQLNLYRKRGLFGFCVNRTERVLYFSNLFLKILGCFPFSVLFCIVLIPYYIFLRFKYVHLVFAPMAHRIGHLAAAPELYLAKKDLNLEPKNRHVLYYFPLTFRRVNGQLERMLKRSELPIHFSYYYLSLIHRLLGHKIYPDFAWAHEDRFGAVDQTDPHFFFTKNEEKQAINQLSKMGISQTDSVVGLMTRGPGYLDSRGMGGKSYDHRNCSIQNYEKGIQQIIDQGRFVIRMGSIVDDVLDINHPKYIEYKSRGFRTELLDIYIPKICRYFISCGTGLECVTSYWFRRPMVYINVSNINHFSVWVNGLIIFKRFWLKSEKRFLSMTEIKQMGACCFEKTQHIDSGIELVENSAEEIFEVIKEQEKRLDGSWLSSENDDEYQRQFWEKYRAHMDTNHDAECVIHKRQVYNLRVGTQFLKDNLYLLD